MHRKETGDGRWRLLACALLGLLLCGRIGQAVAQETHSPAGFEDGVEKLDKGGIFVRRFRMRVLKDRRRGEAAIETEASDAKHFAARLKRQQRRHFSIKRREFKKLQLRLETQRRVRKARIKARQFAAARRHAAQHSPDRRRRKASSRAKNFKRDDRKLDPSAPHPMVISESPGSKASGISLDRNEENRDAR